MSDPISSIRNLGPAMEEAFEKVGITSADQLRELGTDAAYAKLLAAGTRPHFIGYYVIEMGLQGRPWNDCKGAEKDALRARFDALKAQNGPADTDPFEKIFNEIGLLER
ncbi:MAG: TfoX/Sxy family protein [Pseudomonadota bacterium]